MWPLVTMWTGACRQVNLISPEHRVVLVVRGAAPERMNRRRARLLSLLQDLSGGGQSAAQRRPVQGPNAAQGGGGRRWWTCDKVGMWRNIL